MLCVTTVSWSSLYLYEKTFTCKRHNDVSSSSVVSYKQFFSGICQVGVTSSGQGSDLARPRMTEEGIHT